MAYVGVRPVDVIDLSKSDALNVTTSATIGGELTVDTNTLKVDSTNNRVGIGDATPDSTLHISGTDPVIQFTDTNTGADAFLDANSGTGSFTIAVDENSESISSKLNIRVDGTAIMTVDNSTVGIGVTNPDAMLHMKSSSNPKILMSDVTTANSAELECDGGALTINSVSATKFEIGGSEISRIISGKIGIGTTTPENPIEVETSNTLGSTFTGTTAGEGLRVTQSSYTDGNFVSLIEAPYQPNGVPNVRIGAEFTSSGSKLVFGTSNSFGSGITVRAASINHNGNIHIGRDTGTPTTSDPNGCKIENNGRIVNGRDVNGTGNVLVCNGNAGTFRVMGDGDAENTNNNYTGLSDEKLKENIVDATSQWDDIKAVRVRKFSFKSANKSSPTHIGVIAQELEASGMSGLVKEVEVDTDPEDMIKSVKYSILYMKAVKALQEAMARIETLETKVAALEAE